MRVKGATIQQFVLGLALLMALCWNLARASEIKHLRVEAGATGTRAELSLDRETAYEVISLTHPDRLVVDLPGVALGRGLELPAAAGLVKSVRTGHPVPGTTRIVFDLAAPVMALKPRFEPGADGARLVLEWPGDGATSSGPATASTSDAAARWLPQPEPAARHDVVREDIVRQDTPRQDPGLASAAATSRLIARLPPVTPSNSLSASPPQPQPTGDPSLSRAVPTPNSSDPASAANETRVATGIPTRIATGVPATPPDAAASRTIAADKPASDSLAPNRLAPNRVMRSGMRPLIVAIDPGHGGQDPGAIGLEGKREKDVTLAIARELARQVNATPGLKAYLTRDTDVFIPLPRRAQLARAAKADIFVSIHADAAENRSARGSSVYVLSLRGASSQRARWLADKENSADLIGGVRLGQADNTLASVLLDLTQSGHMKASEDAAGHVLSGLKRVGSNHKPNIERANFAVLRTSDMPAMLVETAFISNPEEERRLTDPDHQRTLARAVLDGINTYFTSQPPPGTLYAARASLSVADTSGAGGGSP